MCSSSGIIWWPSGTIKMQKNSQSRASVLKYRYKLSEWEPPEFLQTLSTLPPNLKSAETLKELMWVHRRRSSAGITASEWRVDDAWNTQQTMIKAKRKLIFLQGKAVSHKERAPTKMSGELLVMRADVGVEFIIITSCICLLHPPLTWSQRRISCCCERVKGNLWRKAVPNSPGFLRRSCLEMVLV